MPTTNEGFISRLRTASIDDLRKSRGRSVAVMRVCMVCALVFFVGAVIAGITDAGDRLSFALAVAVLQLVCVTIFQTRVWFIDLVLSEKMTTK